MQASLTWFFLHCIILVSGIWWLNRARAPRYFHLWAWPLLLWSSILLPTARWPLPSWSTWAASLAQLQLWAFYLPSLEINGALLVGVIYFLGFAWMLACWVTRLTHPMWVAAFRQKPEYATAQLLMDSALVLLWWQPLAWYGQRLWQQQLQRLPYPCQSLRQIALHGSLWLTIMYALCNWPHLHQWTTRHFDQPLAAILTYPLWQYRPAPTDTAQWWIQWGPLKLTLHQQADGKLGGTHQILLSDWQQVHHVVPRLWHGQTEVTVHTFQITMWQDDLGTVRAMPWPANKWPNDHQLDWDGLVGWQLYLQAEGAVVHSLVVHVNNPEALYYPPVPLPAPPETDTTWPFQIVSLPNMPTIIRLDTTEPRAAKLIPLYSDSTRYQLIHVPGFRTYRRLINESEDLFARSKQPSGLWLQPPIDYWHLPEWTSSTDQYIGLCVGNLCAAPELSLIRPEVWRGAKVHLQVDTLALELVQAELIVQKPAHPPQQYWLWGDIASQIAELRASQSVPTSFYFQNLVIRDNNHKLWHVARAFAFHTAAKGMWHVQMRGAPPLSDSSSIYDTVLVFSGSLRQLLEAATQTRANRIDIPPHLAERPVSLSLYLNRDALRATPRILLETLRRMYHLQISSSWQRPSNHYALIADYRDQLQLWQVKDSLQLELRQALANDSPWYETLGAHTLDELAHQLEERFGIYISLWQPPTGKYFFSLPTHSLAQTAEVLAQQYGLTLEQTFRPLQMIVVRSPSRWAIPTVLR